jgi:hypothetical protein
MKRASESDDDVSSTHDANRKLIRKLLKGAVDAENPFLRDESRTILELIAPEPGYNFRWFSHANRMTICLIYTTPEFADKVAHQTCDALMDGKSFVVCFSQEYKFVLLNPTVKVAAGILTVLITAINVPLITQLLGTFIH